MLGMALLTGALGGAGLFLLVRELLPAEPNLGDALTRLGTQRPSPTVPGGGPGLQNRLGLALHTRVGSPAWLRVPTKDLALLQTPVHHWLGEKILLALLGLVFPPLLSLVTGLLGMRLPVLLSAAGSLLLAAALFHLPNLVVRDKAAKARSTFARAVGAYIELVALERISGTGTRQALENAADVAESWPFLRIREELLRARMSGQTPWAGLEDLATVLDVPQLSNLADIMRRAGEDGAQIYTALRARGRSLRTELLTNEQSRANEQSERMVMPVAVLAIIFVVILAAPAVLRIL